MSASDSQVDRLGHGPLFPFADPIDPSIPWIAAGCYTIWDMTGRYIYAGMAGRNMTVESIAADRAAHLRRARGLRDRLGAHKHGARSGDQFCIYVFDLLVLPTLTPSDIAEVVARKRRLDDDVRRYIADHLSYRWVETSDAQTARELEAALVGGTLGHLPQLNPRRVEAP